MVVQLSVFVFGWSDLRGRLSSRLLVAAEHGYHAEIKDFFTTSAAVGKPGNVSPIISTRLADFCYFHWNHVYIFSTEPVISQAAHVYERHSIHYWDQLQDEAQKQNNHPQHSKETRLTHLKVDEGQRLK